MRVGQSGEVVTLEAPDQAGFRRLFALGLVPGVRVTLLQRFPAYVFTAGRTVIAMDEEMARTVRVRPG
jgi:Fe2+ transport system protein FeoA